MTINDMDCAVLDERLAGYLEGEVDAADRRQIEAHVASCVRCTALVRDLDRIRAGAAELPELTPSVDLWSGIARRIDTPVVPFTPRPAPNATVARRNFDGFRRAAIAAALVAVTAGVTYTLTVARGARRSDTATVATVQPSATDTNTPASATDTTPRDTASAAPNLASSDPTSPGVEPSLPTPPGSAASQPVLNEAAPATYSREIDRLRTIFVRNRSQLDPRTAAIIEANLRVIDDAIAQSKAALAHDPASQFLSEQLKIARDKKLELLKTAALLPNRT